MELGGEAMAVRSIRKRIGVISVLIWGTFDLRT